MEAGMKQWMGCICRAAACPYSSSALLRMRGVLVDMLRDDQTGLPCKQVTDKRRLWRGVVACTLSLKPIKFLLDCS